MEKRKIGYWSIATQKHLKNYKSDSANLDELDTLHVSGKAGRFIGMIRGNTQIEDIRKIEKMAGTIGIGKLELHNTIFPVIEEASDKKIELIKNTLGTVTGVAEYVFTNDEVLDITGEFFEGLNPSNIERIAVETLNETKKLPLLQNELMSILDNGGFKERDILISCAIQEQFSLLQKLERGKEPIYSNEYVWGPNHEKIAYGLKDLDIGDRDELGRLIDQIQKKQGYPSDNINNINKDLLFLAKKTGIINPTRIVTNRKVSKEFYFSSNLINEGLYNDDILDDVKILLSAIRFGENYTQYSNLSDPTLFLEALIDRDRVGPHSANGTDYIMLEKRGIVRTFPSTQYPNRYFMELIKKDVGQAALNIIANPIYDIDTEVRPVKIDSVMQEGNFLSPEEIRLSQGESPENVKEAEEYFLRAIRNENM